MANNQSFKIKNGLSAGSYLQSTSSVSSSTVDLSAGSYLSKTLTGDTTLTFSNPPASGKAVAFLLEITGGSGSGISGSSYDNKLFNYGSQTVYARGFSFKSDGSRMFIVSGGTSSTRRVYQYNLTTNWDVSTASYSTNKDISPQGISSPEAVTFKTDGTVMYVICRDTDTVWQYNLSTAWAVNTASYANKNFSVSSQETQPTGVRFKSDGTKMFVVGFTGDDVNEYNLSTAWDVSTATYSQNFSVSSKAPDAMGIEFNSDGTLMVIADSAGSGHAYVLSTAWDVSTASFKDSFNTTGQVNTGDLHQITIGDSDSKLYALDNNDDEIYQYTLAGPNASITWPSSVKWEGGETPTDSFSGEKDMYSFITADNGSTYYGKKIGLKLS